MEGALLLDVVVRKSATIFKLLSCKDETLLVGRDTLLVLDLCLHVVDRVGRFNFERDSLSGKSLDENLHSTTETQDEVKSRFLLDVVVGQGAAIFQLLASEDQTLLVGRDTLLVLDLGLDVVDGVARLNLKGDGLASEGLDDCEKKS